MQTPSQPAPSRPAFRFPSLALAAILALPAAGCDSGAPQVVPKSDAAAGGRAAGLRDAEPPDSRADACCSLVPTDAASDDGSSLASDAADACSPCDGAATTDASDGAAVFQEPLRLRFEPIAHDATARRMTDLAFFPDNSGEFLVTNKDGDVVHLKLDSEGAHQLGTFRIDDVYDDSDGGLISIALDPDFSQNNFFYVGMTISRESNIVRRYTFSPGDYSATKASGVLVMKVTGEGAPYTWHNVGALGFTEEGYLWILFGDKRLSAEAQNLDNPLGKLLRVIPDHDSDGGYTVPASNPFATAGGDPRIFAYGLRSPWRGIYHQGEWFVGDVGESSYEEVNRITEAGQSFGWPKLEGPCGDDCGRHQAPWDSYGRGKLAPYVVDDTEASSRGLRSVCIGWIYRNNSADPYLGRWNNVITFNDFGSGFVRARAITGRGASWHAGHLWKATSWKQGPDGYVYVTALGKWFAQDPDEPSGIYRAVLADAP